jgi:hypothetical protein
MFKSLKKSVSKSNNEKPTGDQASTFSYATTLKPDDTSEVTLKPDATQKKEKVGMLAKLGAKKDGFLEKLEGGTPMGRSNATQKKLKGGTPMGRSNATQKKLKEAGDTDKGPRDNNPTYPVMYMV